MTQTRYHFATVRGRKVFYREAGDASLPAIILLHGFPSSSFMFRGLIPLLAENFHVIAPDYIGFGQSDAPSRNDFVYSFETLTAHVAGLLDQLGVNSYVLYMQDYGGPVGFRIVTKHPEKLDWLVIQNTNAYEVGFTPAWDGFRGALWKNRSPETEKPLAGFLTHDAIKGIYLHGSPKPELISPDNWESDYGFMQRPNEIRVNLDLFYDYRNNVALYPVWQKFLRDHQPRTIIFWGQDDPFFTPAGAEAIARDNPNATVMLIDGGHFALEEYSTEIAAEMRALADRVAAGTYRS